MLRLTKIYKDEFKENFLRDFLDPHYKGGKYLFGTNDTASALATALKIDGFINTRDNNLREFMGKPVIHNPASLDSDALVMSCVHLTAAAADILLSAFSFRHLDAFALSMFLTGGGRIISIFIYPLNSQI